MKQVTEYRRFVLFFLLLLALVGLTAWQAYAGSNAPYPTGELPRIPLALSGGEVVSGVAAERVMDTSLPRTQQSAYQPFSGPEGPAAVQQSAPFSPQDPGGDVTCYQFLSNTELDVLDFGDGTGTAEPWVILDQIVYFDDSAYVSPIHSLVLVDADAGDTGSPNQDAFAQAVNMVDDLVYVEVDYYTAMNNINSGDRVLGNLWTVDANGYLDTFVDSWIVGEPGSPLTWEGRYYPITDPTVLAQLSDQRLAVLLFSQTDGGSPGEVVWFDDVNLYACVPAAPNSVYLPSVNKSVPIGPACNPPTENPPDSWYSARGYVSTGALCNTTLSSLDDRDYYSYTPTQSGNHTLHLRNLPSGSNWAALMYDDTEPPPGGPTDGGSCYTSAPGDGNKSVTCNLQAGKDYVIKVSVGGTPMQGSYQMQVTTP